MTMVLNVAGTDRVFAVTQLDQNLIRLAYVNPTNTERMELTVRQARISKKTPSGASSNRSTFRFVWQVYATDTAPAYEMSSSVAIEAPVGTSLATLAYVSQVIAGFLGDPDRVTKFVTGLSVED